MPEEQFTIYLMGHSALDRDAYRLLLRHEFEMEIATESNFAPTAVWAAMRSKPELVLVATDTPTEEVRSAVQMIPRLCAQTRILIVGASVDDEILGRWGTCGIQGYAVKDGGIAELRAAITALRSGESYYSDGVQEAIARGHQQANNKPKLSRRETELLPLLARGMTLRDAAASMTVSYKTADSYRTSLLRKVGVRDRVGLARYAIRERIVEA